MEITQGVEPAATPAAEPKTFSSFAEERASWTPEQKKTWDETGKEPERPTETAQPAVNTTPEPVKAEVTPGSGPDDLEDQDEPEYYGTPEQQKAQRHAFAKKSRQLAEARAEAKILREQLAAHKPAVAAAAPKAEPTPEAKSKIVRPELPDVTDPKYDVENGLQLYQADMREFHRLDKEADRQERQEWLAEERRKDLAERQKESTTSQWVRESAQAKEAHTDFEAVAFSEKLPLSLPMVGVLTSMKGGPEILYQLGLNLALAGELATDTAIPGYESYEELAAAAEGNPQLARQLAAAEAIVRHEAKRILSGAAAAKPNPGPTPITVSRASAPPERVDSRASATKDPIAEAWAQYEKTGDHKYLTLANKLEDERDLAARRR